MKQLGAKRARLLQPLPARSFARLLCRSRDGNRRSTHHSHRWPRWKLSLAFTCSAEVVFPLSTEWIMYYNFFIHPPGAQRRFTTQGVYSEIHTIESQVESAVGAAGGSNVVDSGASGF